MSEPIARSGTAETLANPPLKVVLIVNVGHALNTYPNHGPWCARPRMCTDQRQTYDLRASSPYNIL
jgi:hypothetical protein